MRWRMIDRLWDFTPWRHIRARKMASLEEYCLLEILGVKGLAPGSLLLGAALEAIEWLVAQSSDYSRFPWADEINDFAIIRYLRPAEILDFSINICASDCAGQPFLSAGVKGKVRTELVCQGVITVKLADWPGPYSINKKMWKELYRDVPASA
ncbi:MAG: hypothetical protein LBJ14_05895 [Desulfarculales bacterium]|jgi:hypothetical protein|nr:hypothetical protein [Desulfarculales bacterium]